MGIFIFSWAEGGQGEESKRFLAFELIAKSREGLEQGR